MCFYLGKDERTLMLEFIQLCFAPVNILFTLMLICVMGYWSMFFVGVIGLDVLDDIDLDLDADVDVDIDLDLDVDADVDVDVDTDVDTDLDSVETGGRAGWFISLLKFMDVGDVPLMVVLTALVGSLWAVSILSSYYFNPSLSGLVALLLFVPDFLISLLIAKIATFPAAVIFRKTNSGIEKNTKIIGRTCYVTTSRVTETSGQAEIRLDDAAPITLNVRCRSDQGKSLTKGDEALILELVEDKGTYIVVPFNLEVT